MWGKFTLTYVVMMVLYMTYMEAMTALYRPELGFSVVPFCVTAGAIVAGIIYIWRRTRNG